MPHLECCCYRKQGRTLRKPSQFSPPLQKWWCLPYFSESCCCSGFACRYLLRHARAPAVAASTRSGVTSGVLASRALPLERATDVPVSDDRRIEVVANGFSLWHGAQQAVDATIDCAVTRAGDPHPGAYVHPGRAVDGAAGRKRRQAILAQEWLKVLLALMACRPR